MLSPHDDKLSAALRCAHLGLAVFPTWGAIARQDGRGFACGCGLPHCHNAAKHPHPLALRGLHAADDGRRSHPLLVERCAKRKTLSRQVISSFWTLIAVTVVTKVCASSKRASANCPRPGA